MSTAGPNPPASASTQTGPGTVAWNNVDNIFVADAVYATTNSLTASAISIYIRAQDYGFSIPVNSDINGIEVDVLCSADGVATIEDQSIRLLTASGLTGSDLAVASQWPTFPTESYRTYGGPSELWGTSWAPSDINDVNFGAAVSAVNNGAAPGVAYVDFISITVTYTLANQVAQQVIVARPPQAAYDWTQKPD